MVKYLLPFVKKGSFNGPFFHNVVVSLSVLGSPWLDLLRLDPAGLTSGWTEVTLGWTEVTSGWMVVTAGSTVVATALAEVPTSLTEVPMISILIPLLVNILVV